MERNTEELLQGEQEVARRLNAIRNSKRVQEFITGIKEDVENSGISVKFKSRIKENESAINKYKKYIEQRGEADPEMWDSCGMMVIVEDINEIYELKKYFEEKLNTRDGGLNDYVQNPKAGYRSVHMYSTFEAEGITVPSEIQIKTEAMSIAQDTIHDSVYKLKEMPYEKRNELSTAMFPIFEKSADANKLENHGDVEGAAQLRAEVEQLRNEYSNLFAENQAVVENVWKEYGKVLFNHHNIDEVEGTLFLKNANLTKEDKVKINEQLGQALNILFSYYKENANENIKFPSISGDKNVDFAIYQLSNMGYSDFVREYKSIIQQKSQKESQKEIQKETQKETQKEELIAGTGDFAKLDEEVTPEMRQSMMSELSRAMQERTTDKNIDNTNKNIDNYERE